MAIHSTTSSNFMFSLRVALISSILLSLAVILKLYAPLMADFVVYDIASVYSLVLSWFRPPYLYLVINCIIISIVASSKLQQKVEDRDLSSPEPAKRYRDGHAKYVAGYGGAPAANRYDYGDANAEPEILKFQTVEADGVYPPGEEEIQEPELMILDSEKKASMGGDDEVAAWRSAQNIERSDSMEFPFLTETESMRWNERPPVSARFAHRKIVKASPEGKSLGVSRSKRHDTLENTWKTITEGRAMPLTRHLKKSDTWDTHVRHSRDQDPSQKQKMTKSETFNDRTKNPSLNPSPGSGRLRRDPSLSQDELNRRVEAFIMKFNEEMRLQRQESLNQYQEMISRGAY